MSCDRLSEWFEVEDLHKWDHTLLKVREIVTAKAVQSEVSKLHDSVKALDSKVDGKLVDLQGSLKNQFDERVKALEDRFSRVEGMLEKILSQNAILA
jgi:hypothetical protein